MGYHYSPIIPPPTVEVNLTPVNPPIIIPANGGWFVYNINVHNYGTQMQTFNVWNRLRLPNGSLSAPVLGPITRNLMAGGNPTRTFQQTIAGGQPAGVYQYISYVGLYPWVISDSSYFPFTILAARDGGPWIAESKCDGDFPDELTSSDDIYPSSFILHPSVPNPFNPTTVLSYELRVPSQVRLTVYDTAGRLVSTLVNGWTEAGVHSTTFDGSALSSGVYLVRLEAGTFTAVEKVVLLK